MSAYPSKIKMSKCYYCKEEMKDENLAKHCKLKHNAAKCVLGEESVSGYFATSAKSRGKMKTHHLQDHHKEKC